MNVQTYIEQISMAKSEVLKKLESISWPQTVPYEENDSEPSDSKGSSGKFMTPLLGGTGGVSVVCGLITNKIGFTIAGAALLIGSLIAWKNNKPTPKTSHSHTKEINYNAIVGDLNNKILTSVQAASEIWNSKITSVHNQINTTLLSMDLPDSRKTDLLSIAATEHPLILSTMEITMKLRTLSRNKDLEGMKSLLTAYKSQCIQDAEKVYNEQVRVYENVAN